MLACEVEGGTARGGRHTNVLGYREDCHKYNSAAMLGWTVIRGDSHMVAKRHLVTYLRDAIEGRQPTLVKKGRSYVVPAKDDPWIDRFAR